MDPIATFQGLATGVNFRDLVDQIIQAESRPVVLLNQRKVELDRRLAAWTDFQRRVQSLDDLAERLGTGAVFDTFRTSVSGETGALSVSAGAGASPGSYAVEVQQLASRERLGSDVFGTRDGALGISGEFLVGGRAVALATTDSLDDLVASINAANTGGGRSRVSASVVGSASSGYRVVLTADDAGEAGIRLADGADGTLRALGFLDGVTSLRSPTSDGARSDPFTSAISSVGGLLGLSASPPAGTVQVGSLSVAIDLASDSLDDIAAAINEAAETAGSGIRAAVTSEAGPSGGTVRRMDISGTTSFVDADGVLETLGILESGRSTVAQRIQGATFTVGDATTAAGAGALLTDLWQDGASAGVQAGDTLSIAGTRGDGSAFTKTFEVEVGSTVQDLLDALNSAADGFGSGTRTATASVLDGALVVTDGTGGNSQLALSIVTHNEGGGRWDFGAFTVETSGRDREIAAGVDARVEVDGVLYQRSGNSVSDIVPGVTLALTDVSASPALVSIERDVDAIATEIQSFIEAFNSISGFVGGQFSGAGADGRVRPALSGEGILRSMRSQMRAALESSVAGTLGAGGGLRALGIEINRNGTYDIDAAALRAAVGEDPLGVRQLFAAHGTTSISSLRYLSAGEETEPGDYPVVVTQVATRATVTGTGFAGSYLDDGTADLLTIADLDTGSEYTVSLSNGMTLEEIVEALNEELGTGTHRALQASSALMADALGTPATEQTTLDQLFDGGGTNMGVTDGDVLTLSGERDDGTAFFREWTVTSAATQTLGDLRSEISQALGEEVVVGFSDGVLTLVAREEGRGSFTLSLSSDNAGGGTFGVGGIQVGEEGRAAARIRAEASAGNLTISHEDYGSASGFTLSVVAAGTDGSASLGVTPGSYAGIDVVGTIGGDVATGLGQTLTAAAGSASGLAVVYAGASIGAVGTVSYARGLGGAMARVTSTLLSGDAGSIQSLAEGIDTQKRRIDKRVEAFEARIELRSENLIRRFTALEEAMAQAQQQLQWLQAQLGSLLASPEA